MEHDITSIARQFRTGGDFLGARPWGAGHINDTYLADYDYPAGPLKVVIQRINHNVFKDPPAVMENIVRITNYIRGKLQAKALPDAARRVLTVIPALDGAGFFRDAGGNYWRAYHFIKGGKTYDVPESPGLVAEAARMFGEFICMLADLPGPPLHETIKNFHNGPKRFLAFRQAVEADSHNRAARAKPEIDYILKHQEVLNAPGELADKGEIPACVTHNDTKINNIIFDCPTGQGLCVIDLDTVMPGLSLYDFGDMVRTAACRAAEDEQDLSGVSIDMGLYEALARGFLQGAASMLRPAEIKHLPFAGMYITLEQAARFLTDYLRGDVYYKVHRHGHNLDRCRTQLKLVQSMYEREGEMLSVVQKM